MRERDALCLDVETGLYYYGSRFLNSGIGRWMSRDPIGEIGGVNLFAFVRNSTANHVDLLGMSLVIPPDQESNMAWGKYLQLQKAISESKDKLLQMEKVQSAFQTCCTCRTGGFFNTAPDEPKQPCDADHIDKKATTDKEGKCSWQSRRWRDLPNKENIDATINKWCIGKCTRTFAWVCTKLDNSKCRWRRISGEDKDTCWGKLPLNAEIEKAKKEIEEMSN